MMSIEQKKIIFILGYGQKVYKDTALKRLWGSLDTRFYKCIYEWDTNPERLAASISGRVMLVGYSYGGYTIKLVADHMAKDNKIIDYYMSIDAVWRKKTYKPSIKSLNKKRTIVLPGNINNAYIWRQKTGVIKGHKVIAQSTTIKYESLINHTPHFRMDNDLGIHSIINSVANDFLSN